MQHSPRPAWIALDDLFAFARPDRKRYRFALFAAAGLLLAVVWWLGWSTGGSRGPNTHAAYLPILLMGVTLGIEAAVVTAAFATLALGPLMPLDVSLDLAQRPASWLSRGGFFVLIGACAGAGFQVVQTRAARIEELRGNLASTYSRNLRDFAGLVEGRDEQTYGPCERVGRNAVAIGRRLGLARSELGRLSWACCTTWARSGCPKRSCARRAGSRRRSSW